METKTTILVDNLGFPESHRWHDGALWFSDMFASRVMRVDLQGKVQLVAELPDMPIGLDWTPDGLLLVVSANARQLLRLEGDKLVKVADMSGLVAYPCNDMVVDGQGRAYIGNLGFDFGNPEVAPQPGPILLVTPDGSARVAADGLAFPNGMVISSDGQTLIVAESHAARLTAFTIESDGSLSQRRVWAQFDGQITPDGICLDAEDCLWVASPNTKEVLRVRKGAEITCRILLDNIPLACGLGGRTLFISTTESLDPGEARGRIETVRVDIPGAT